MWGGIVMGGIAGAGKELSAEAAERSRAELDRENLRFRADLDKETQTHSSNLALQREQTMLELRNSAEIKMIPERAKATADAELATAGTRAQAKLQGELSPEVTAAQARAEAEKQSARSRAETDELKARGNDKDAIAAIRRIAQAQHVESSASAAQAELARMSIAEKKEVLDLLKQYDATDDPKAKTAIKDKLVVRGVIKPSETDIEKVTEEKMNSDGTTTKVERTQRRQAGGAGGGQPVAAPQGPWSKYAAPARDGAASTAAPATPTQAEVPGRPFYNTPTRELKDMALKPRGVSSAQAMAASEELEARKGESRMGSF